MNDVGLLVEDLLEEKVLSADQRAHIPSAQFGLPEQRKFPLHDAEHVRKAIQLFHQCELRYRTQLAKAIEVAARRYGVTITESSGVGKVLRRIRLKS